MGIVGLRSCWISCWIMIYVLLLIIFFWLFPNDLYPMIERKVYGSIIVVYVIIGGGLIYAVLNKSVYVFEPIVLISLMYLAIFVFMPIHDILNHYTTQYGKYIMNGGVRANIIVAISYIAFFICYYFKQEVYRLKKKKQRIDSWYLKKKVVRIALVIWLISFILYIYYTVSNRGLSLDYISSLRFYIMQDDTLTASSPLAFLNKFGNSLAIPYLYICVFSKSKFLKLVVLLLTLIVYFINGSRYVMIIFLAGPIIYRYIKRKQSPKILYTIVLLVFLLFSCAFIASMRHGMRAGEGSSAYDSFTTNDIFDPFYSNFTLYKTFYGVVETFPDKHQYQLGRGMILGTLILFIPRALWPEKPREAICDYIEWSINKRAQISGLAYNNIGEYYVEFGVLGCVFFMGLLGYGCRKMKRLYASPNKTVNTLILYSVLLPCLFAIINAGWTPMNFYTILFCIFPWFILKRFLN